MSLTSIGNRGATIHQDEPNITFSASKRERERAGGLKESIEGKQGKFTEKFP